MPLISNILNVINNLYLTNQASDPANTAGKTVVYTKTDGLYARIAGGTVIGPMAAGSVPAYDASGWTAAGETWTYASADGPTGVFTVAADVTGKYSMGMRVKLTQTTVKYGIVVAISYGAPNTTITIYMGTDYTLASAAITSPYYSAVKAPFGFPLGPAKWTVETTDTTSRSQSSAIISTWYNLGSINIVIPIGVWHVSYKVSAVISGGTAGERTFLVTLSTANNSESDNTFTSSIRLLNGYEIDIPLYTEKILALASKETRYINTKYTADATANYIGNRNDLNPLSIRAVCAYL